MFVLVIHIY